MRRRRGLRVGLALVALLGAILAVEARYYRGASRACHPPRMAIGAEEKAAARARLPGLEDVAFTTADGLVLRGFYLPAENGATVILGHGLGDNRMHFLPDVEMLARHGYGALFFDWRGHGESDGEGSTWSDREQMDLRAAVDFVARRPDVQEGRIAALGFSIGASTVALEAATDPRVRAVVLEAVYTSLDDEVAVKWGGRGFVSRCPARIALKREGLHFSHIRPIDHVAEIAPRPILAIAGSDDLDTPVAVVARVYDAATQPKRMWIAQGAGHGEYEKAAPAEFERELIAFLDSAFLVQSAH